MMRSILNVIFLSFLVVVSASCTRSDKGEKFTLGPASEPVNPGTPIDGGDTNQPNPPAKPRIESESCSYQFRSGVTMAEEIRPYGVETEQVMDELLNSYVTPLTDPQPGFVKYVNWWASNKDLGRLCDVLESFRITDISEFSLQEKKAFYINAYNMMTIDLILRNYLGLAKSDGTDRSITHIRAPGEAESLGFDVWDTFTWEIAGKEQTLNLVEKKILIPMGDARIHFAVNCASKGCPPLSNQAFRPERLEDQLDEMSRYYVNNPTVTRIEYDAGFGEGFIDVSQIFDWYAVDFEKDISGKYNNVRSFLVHYLDPANLPDGVTASDLLDDSTWFLGYLSYDWSLNEKGAE